MSVKINVVPPQIQSTYRKPPCCTCCGPAPSSSGGGR